MYAAKPETVHVLTPPSSHCAVTLEALENGCHVFVEKPMAASEQECDRMIEKAAAVQRILSVNHSAKFDPAVEKATRLIQAGRVGDVLSIDYFRSSEYPPYRGGPLPPPYQQAGYPYRDIGVHALYLMEAFLGEIRNVEARYSGTGRNIHLLFDEWSALVECERGTGQFRLSWAGRPIQHLLWVHGTRGNILLDLYIGSCVTFNKLPLPKPVEAILNSITSASHSVLQALWNSIRVATGQLPPGADIDRSINEFYTALSTGSTPPVSTTEGKRMVRWVEKVAREADAQEPPQSQTHGVHKPASVLVTGATGFLGRALVDRLLSKGERVRVLTRRNSIGSGGIHPCVDVFTGDLGDPDAVDRAIRGVSVVFHLGAATNGSLEDYECGTIWGTKNVVDSCLRHRVGRLVYVSSLSVLQYASLPSDKAIDESSTLEPFPKKRGHYASSKLKAEQIVKEAVRTEGLNAVILRPGSIFGPGAESVPPYGIVSMGNHWIVMGNGKTLLPLVYVEDVVDALVRSAECGEAAGEVIQLVDPNQINQEEYLQFCSTKNPQIKTHHVPMLFLYCAAIAWESLGRIARIEVPLTVYRLRSIKPRVKFDCVAAQKILGWRPQVGLSRGLDKTFRET
jgi:nucleoside-diphosphate-sugar epimerase/predicted dehydrogenase